MPADETAPHHVVELLEKHHNREAFSCGVPELDRYLRTQALQDRRRNVAATFTLVERQTQTLMGYYTLSAFVINIGDLPEDTAKALPRYPQIPATLLGRLAVSQQYQGKGHGEFLLIDALCRSLSHSGQIASFAVVVDAKDERAAGFYRKYEFTPFPSHQLHLFLSMKKIAQLF